MNCSAFNGGIVFTGLQGVSSFNGGAMAMGLDDALGTGVIGAGDMFGVIRIVPLAWHFALIGPCTQAQQLHFSLGASSNFCCPEVAGNGILVETGVLTIAEAEEVVDAQSTGRTDTVLIAFCVFCPVVADDAFIVDDMIAAPAVGVGPLFVCPEVAVEETFALVPAWVGVISPGIFCPEDRVRVDDDETDVRFGISIEEDVTSVRTIGLATTISGSWLF